MTGTDTFTSTDLQYVIQTVYSPKVEREWRANLIAADFFTDFSRMFAGGGSSMTIADVFTNQFSAATKSNGSEVTLISPAQGTLSLAVNTWKEISYLIEDKELQQILQGSDVLEAYASQAKYIISKALDTSLMGLYSGLSQTVNDTANDVADVDIRSAIETVVDGDVPLSQLAFMFHSTVIWHDLFGISKYTGVYTAGGDPVSTGMLGGATAGRQEAYRGRLYGTPVFETTQVQADAASSAYYNLLAHPKSFCYATMTPGGKVRSQSSYLATNLGTLWTTDIIYGVAELRDDSAVVIKSRQSGVVS